MIFLALTEAIVKMVTALAHLESMMSSSPSDVNQVTISILKIVYYMGNKSKVTLS